MRSSFAIALILFTLSCSGENDDGMPGRDASTNDSGTNDSGTNDSGTNDDSGTNNDSGTDDTGTQDTGTNDTGTDDTGTQDTGTADTGVEPLECDPDFGQPDACGGDLDGTWTYRVACGSTPVASMIEQQCATVDIRADRIEGGSGTLVVSGAAFDLDVSIDVHVEVGLPAACVFMNCPATQAILQQALPQSTIACTAAGAGCDCTIDGPVGYETFGTVTTNGGVATVDGTDTYYYCVQGGGLIYRQFGTGTNEPVFVLDE